MDPIIRRMLRCKGIERAIVLRQAEEREPKGVPHKEVQGFEGYEEEDMLFCFVSRPKRSERNPKRGTK